MGTRPGTRADNVDPPLGGEGEGGIKEEPSGPPDYGIDETGGTGMTPEERAVSGVAKMNAALGGFAPTVVLEDHKPPEDKAEKHARKVKRRAEVRRNPKKGRMVSGGREGRKVN